MNLRTDAASLEEHGAGSSFSPSAASKRFSSSMRPLETGPVKILLQNLLQLQELEFGDVKDSATEAAISKLRQKIPLPILEHYSRLPARGKKGVAFARHQVCSGCHLRIPIGAINTLMHGEDIQMCENCGRYLALPTEAPVEPASAVVAPIAPEIKTRRQRKPVVHPATN